MTTSTIKHKTAFEFYRDEVFDQVKKELGNDASRSDVSHKVAEYWANLPSLVRTKYIQLGKEDRCRAFYSKYGDQDVTPTTVIPTVVETSIKSKFDSTKDDKKTKPDFIEDDDKKANTDSIKNDDKEEAKTDSRTDDKEAEPDSKKDDKIAKPEFIEDDDKKTNTDSIKNDKNEAKTDSTMDDKNEEKTDSTMDDKNEAKTDSRKNDKEAKIDSRKNDEETKPDSKMDDKMDTTEENKNKASPDSTKNEKETMIDLTKDVKEAKPDSIKNDKNATTDSTKNYFPDTLPPGWKVESVKRKKQSHADHYYYTPSSSLKLRSKLEVKRFLALQNKFDSHDEEFIYNFMFKNKKETNKILEDYMEKMTMTNRKNNDKDSTDYKIKTNNKVNNHDDGDDDDSSIDIIPKKREKTGMTTRGNANPVLSKDDKNINETETNTATATIPTSNKISSIPKTMGKTSMTTRGNENPILSGDDKNANETGTNTATATIPTSDRISSIKTINGSQDPRLPKGWFIQSIPRICGNHVDSYWFTPITHHKLRSKVEVLKFLALQNHYKNRANDEAYIIEIFKNQTGTTNHLYTKYVTTNKHFVDLFLRAKRCNKKKSTLNEPNPKKQCISTPSNNTNRTSTRGRI